MPSASRKFVMMPMLILFLSCATIRSAEPRAADLEFFEKEIRPILVEHCLECHGEKKTQGNLRLDSPAGWLAGGDLGPAIVPGNPQQSRLIQALAHDGGDLEMPPEGKLDDLLITKLERWIARGAPAPAMSAETQSRAGLSLEEGRQFWAYQPVRIAPLPMVQKAPWPRSPIDVFILQRLEEAGIDPREESERLILCRRLFIDLTGLLPDLSEIERFRNDTSQDATERLTDRLLASPHFGERWARHWLDIVRFAESLTLRGFILPNAWRYRDYVIEVFNENRPYSQFLREQLAGDLLAEGTVEGRQRSLIATTFWTLGNTNLEEQDKKQLDMDVVDEQLDVMGKALLGQTIGCARCHDHKFDPIPTRDYYALAGILRNTKMLEHQNVSKWLERPLPLLDSDETLFASLEARERKLKSALEQSQKRLAAFSTDQSPEKTIVPVADLPGIVIDDEQATTIGRWQASTSNKPYIGVGYVHDLNEGKGDKSVTFDARLPRDGRYQVRLAYSAGGNRAENVPVTVFSAEGEKAVVVNMKKPPTIDATFISLGEFQFESAGQSYVIVSNEGTKGHVAVDAVQFLIVDGSEPVKPLSKEPKQDSNETQSLRAEIKTLEKELKAIASRLRDRPKTMTILECPKIEDCPIHLRGSVHSLGDVVPRGFLSVIGSLTVPPLPSNESGRRELAMWISSTEHPLTSRVYVNRAWCWLLGEGIVRSVDNFGTTGERPSHPELLDWLASTFDDSQGSTKDLVREIVQSATYRAATLTTARPADPENRLLSGRSHRRLDAESLRDAMVFVSGELDDAIGRSSIKKDLAADYGYETDILRRTMYLPVFRNAMPDLLTAFDFPDPSLVTGQRATSTVVPQALFLMNASFVQERAQATARCLLAETKLDDERITVAFLRALSRPPTPREREWAEQILRSIPGDQLGRWTIVVHLLFMSLDFRMYG